MSTVKFSRVISCSSQDPKHPASNLLESQVGKCWRSKTPGEKQVVVILQLERSCRIQSIDIGNENSAFIEILVGRSAVPDHYEVLRIASSMMSVAEAKKGENKNAVQFFKEDDFSKPAADESWDRIKITCTQPFNKLVQYGLSFIKVRTKDTILDDAAPSFNSPSLKNNNSNHSSPSQTSSLGKFKLKQEQKDTNDVLVGSLFAKRNDVKDQSPSTAAAAIRAASTSTEPKLKRLSDLLPGLKDSKKPRPNDVDVSPVKTGGRRSATGRLLYDDRQSDGEDESNVPLRIPRNMSTSKKPKPGNGPLVFRELSDEDPEPDEAPRVKKKSPSKKEKEKNTPNSRPKKLPAKEEVPIPRKPFNRLLEGVVFVISGYQNPFRAELRQKALNMGAKYKADWDNSCTHLICAFPNTPKASSVRGKGWILHKEWIEDCYAQRRRLLSQRMDKNDNSVYGNEVEIHEEIPGQAMPSPPPPPPPPKKVANTTSIQTESESESSSSQNQNSRIGNQDDEENIYEVDTDVDSDDGGSRSRQTSDYETINLEVLPDFLSDKKMYLGADLPKKLSDNLERHIIAFKGEVTDDVDATDYIISEDIRYKENIANSPVLSPEWIWECTSQRRFVPLEEYSL